MKMRSRMVIALILVVPSASLGLGCGGAANESGAGNLKGQAASDAPKNMDEFAKQTVAKNSKAKGVTRPSK